ncbi:MAG: carboxypeptidase regulatory-like domain-containing protein [Planctomycetes bacterium]|nr:carboxypeptidase regulatory-like domain-containing protein [Planctomycetota bacterium]
MDGTKRASLIVVVLALLAGAAWWLAPSGRADRPRLAPVSSAPDGAAMDLGAPVSPAGADALVSPSLGASGDGASSSAEASADDATSAPPPGHARLVLRVLTGARAPVADVAVELELVPRTDDRAPRARTDDTGSVRFDLPAPVRLRGVIVASGVTTGGAFVERRLTLREGDVRTLDVLVPSCGGVAGLVVDAFGNPLADARVSGWTRSLWQLPPDAERDLAPDVETRSDAAGRFELACLGPPFVLSAAAPGRLCSVRLHGTLAPGETARDLRLVLDDAVPLDGRVTRADGSPAPGVRVVASGRDPFGPQFLTERAALFTCDAATVSALSDARGRFRFDALAPRELTFSVDVPDAPPLSVTHDPREGELVLVLGTGCAVAGVVRDADDRPVAGASVRVEGDDVPARSTHSDAEGRYRVGGLAPDAAARVLALADGCAPTVVQPVAVVAEQETWVELRLGRALAITGVLYDAERRPIAGADLVLEGERLVASAYSTYPMPTWERAFGLESAVTDGDGRFAFAQLNAGGYRLEAVHPDDPTLRRSFRVSAGEHDLELVLDPLALSGVTLEGTVRDAQTDRPVAHFDVTPHRHLPDDTFSGEAVHVDDACGHFLLTGLAAGELIVMVTAPGYRPWTRPLARYDDGRNAFDVALVPERSLALRVVDEHGAPVARARVSCLDAQGARLWVQFGAGASAQSLRTDARGEVDVHGLPASTITVIASPADRADAREARAVFDLFRPVAERRVLVIGPSDR